jgi:Zn finger protein HypA/HybF involved in hydrogenase expression
MIAIHFDTAVVLYLLAVLAIIVAAGIYNAIRRWAMRVEPTPTRIFRCANCAHPYLDDHDLELARCPRCGTENEPQRI